MSLEELASADDPTAGEIEPVSDSESRKDSETAVQGRKTGLDSSGSRNALETDDLAANGKGYPMQHRSSTTLTGRLRKQGGGDIGQFELKVPDLVVCGDQNNSRRSSDKNSSKSCAFS